MANELNTADQKALDTFINTFPRKARDIIKPVSDFSCRVRGNYEDSYLILTIEEILEFVNILNDLRMDHYAIAAGFLHDLYRFPDIVKEIKQQFGDEIHCLLTEYGKISLLAKHAKKGESEDDYVHMALSASNDFRVILMLIANRYIRILHYSRRTQKEQIKQAERVFAFYSPLAHRLGLAKYKTAMENTAFKILYPDKYTEISSRISEKRYQLERYITQVIVKLRYELEKHSIASELSGRSKSAVSIYRKMQRTGREFKQIYDILAIRAIVKTIPDCYKVLAIAQQLYKPILEEFDDYIQKPKVNGYQSLHLLLEDANIQKFELQIRTLEMHTTSEIGVAAHWNYKGGNKKSTTDTFFKWFREHATDTGKVFEHKTFERFFHLSGLKNEIFVMTPKGDLKRLPKGSTPIDFAFAIHREVGLHCSGAKIGGQIVPFDRELQNGDSVEILTSNHTMVNSDWAKYAHTSKALIEIRRWLRRQMRMHSVKLGEEILSRTFRKSKISLTNETIKRACDAATYNSVEDLYVAVGTGKLSAKAIINRLVSEDIPAQQEEERIEKPPEHEQRLPPTGIKVGGMNSMMVNFGKCCLPIPGDPIVGYITRGKGVTIHRDTCRNIRQIRKEPERNIEVEWEHKTDKMFAAGLKVVLRRSDNFIKTITPLFGNKKLNLINYRIDHASGEKFCILVIEIPDTKGLNRVMQTINSMKPVKSVRRLHYTDFKPLMRSTPVILGVK